MSFTLYSFCRITLTNFLKLADVADNPPLPLTSHNNATRRQQPSIAPDEELVDPREIDRVVSEVAVMAGRWNLFKKFLSERLEVSLCFFYISDSNIFIKDSSESEPDPTQPPPAVATLEATASHHLFEEILASRYIPLDIWYTRTTIDKASPDTYIFFGSTDSASGSSTLECRYLTSAGDDDDARRRFLHFKNRSLPGLVDGLSENRGANV